MFICFVGIDGSGKTLQAQRLTEALVKKGINCDYVWCRYSPRLLAPFKRMLRKSSQRNDESEEYTGFTSKKRGILKKPVIGWLWLNISILEYLAQAVRTINPRLKASDVLVCDRYIYDFLADVSINFDVSGCGALKLARHPLIRLFPMPDKVFFLDVPPDVAYARKDDPNVMGKQYLVDRDKIYSCLSDGLGATRIDGTKSIDEIAEIVLQDSMGCINGTGSGGGK